MVVSFRAIAAAGLGLLGLTVLPNPTLGQQQDVAVRQTNRAVAASRAAVPPTFGTIDMTAVFKGYDKVKASGEEFKAAAMAKKNELMKAMGEMQSHTEMLAKLTPNSVDFKNHESRVTELKAKIEAEREQAERDFALREAEMLSTLYKEIQQMVSRVARHKGLTYVLRVSNEPVSGGDPRSAVTAIERTVVFAETSNDITQDVVNYLNMEYKAKGNAAVKPTAASAGVRPAGN